jgi:lipopolysaccharide export system protein LptA
LLGVLFVGVSGAHGQQQISAEWVETRLEKVGSSRTYAGNVAFNDVLNALKIQSDSAIVRGSEYLFISNLSFEDSTRTIRAQQLVYDNESRTAKFSGDVFFQAGERSLRAQNIQIWPDSGLVLAWGAADLAFQSPVRHISAETLKYGTWDDFGLAQGDVVATVWGDLGDSITIQTDSLFFSPEKDALSFRGESKIAQSGFLIDAPSGQYDGDKLRTFGRSSISWSQPDQLDSVKARADTVDVLLEDQVLRSIQLISGAEIERTGNREGVAYLNTLKGDAASIEVSNGQILNMKFLGHVSIGYQNQDEDIAFAGESATLWFAGERLDSLVILGQSVGTYQGKDKRASRMSGEQKVLWFEKDDLVKMRLMGNALCTYRGLEQAGDDNLDVGGDVLDLFFGPEGITKIDAKGNVQGMHLPKNTETIP